VKSHLPIVLAVVLVVAAFAVSYRTSRSLQSPEMLLNQKIDEEIEKAQRMLDGYEPAGEQLLTAIAGATTQPVELLPEGRWAEHLNYPPFKDRIQGQASRLQTLTGKFLRLSGDTRPRSAAAVQAFPQLKRDLEENQNRIEDALAIVQKAVAMSMEAGDTVVRGTSHPVATRLEAILLYHKADLLRRRAALHQAVADAERSRLNRIRGSWRELETIRRVLEPETSERSGGEVAFEPDADRADATPSSPAKGGLPGSLLGKLSGWLSGEKQGDSGGEPKAVPPAPPDDTTLPGSEEEMPQAEPGKPAPAEPEMTRSDRVSTWARRLADLETHRKEVLSEIEQARADVSRLSTELSALEAKLAAARSACREAQLAMLTLKDSQLDPTDPESLDRFTAEYRAASKRYREASLEIARLVGAGVPSIRSETDDEKGIPAEGPPTSAGPDREWQPQRGLITSRRAELRAAQIRVEGLEGVLAAIDAQSEEARVRQEDVDQRYSSLEASQAALLKEAAQAGQAAIAAALEAEKLQTEAINVLTDPGKRAAQNAENAASKRINDARSLKNQYPESENPRLNLIAAGQFVVGHAQTIEADIEYLRAQILAQRAHDLQSHHRMLREAGEMGIRGEARLLPELPPGRKVPECFFQTKAAGEAALKAREDAINAAEAALGLYGQADGDLKRLWVLHTNMAAVNYLLANLHPEPQAQEYRDKAIEEYERSIQNRLDQPEAEVYQRIIDGLTQLSP